MNKVILVGLVGSDAELKYTQGGMAIARFRMATSRKRGESEETQWHNITVFGKSAENLARYLVKGKQVGVDGRVEYRTFEKSDGSKGYHTDIVAEDIQLMGGGPRRGEQSQNYDDQRRQARAAEREASDAARAAVAGPGAVNDDDIPFAPVGNVG